MEIDPTPLGKEGGLDPKGGSIFANFEFSEGVGFD